MKSLAVASLLASLALAQTTSNPLIPPNISDACNNFYQQLNANTAITQCLQPVISAMTPLVSDKACSAITSNLDSVCSATTCDPKVIQSQLTLLSQSCNDELNNEVSGVILTYDALYLLDPVKKVLCLKDSTGHYCVANSSSTSKRATLDRRGAQVAFAPNTTTFSQKNLVFLGLEPSLDADKLCVSCTKDIMNIYIDQLNNAPYRPGIDNSVLFPGQRELYKTINTKCGTAFLGGQAQAVAGGLATGAAPRLADSGLAFVSSAFAAAAAGAVALL